MRRRKIRLVLLVWLPAFAALLILVLLVIESFIVRASLNQPKSPPIISKDKHAATPIPSPTLPVSHVIPQQLHVFQSFNNCGPATLSMALSYMGVVKTQAELGQILRPYQVPGGDNDDKSVTLQEVARQAETYGL